MCQVTCSATKKALKTEQHGAVIPIYERGLGLTSGPRLDHACNRQDRNSMDVRRLERRTSSMSTMRSNQLSYTSLTGYKPNTVALNKAMDFRKIALLVGPIGSVTL